MKSPSKPFLKSAASSMLVLIILCSVLSSQFLVGRSSGASPEVLEAETAVQQAFMAVLEAEEAGADVSSLNVKLEEAGTLLAEAGIADRNGDTATAFLKAEDAISKAENIKSEASSLKDNALADAERALQQSLLFSAVGAVAFLGFLGFAWILFKRAYTKKLLKMKPEVTPNDA